MAQLRFNKSLGDSAFDYTITKVIQTDDGGLLICGNTFVTMSSDVFLLKLNANGDSLWSIVFGDSLQENFNSVCELPNGQGYIAVGARKEKGLVSRIDITGNLIWTHTMIQDTLALIKFIDVMITGNDSLLITGYAYDSNYRIHIFLLKADLNFNFGWAKISLGNTDYSASMFFPVEENRFLIGGGVGSNTKPCLMLFDSLGNLQWARSYQLGSVDELAFISNIDTTTDGQFILTLDSWNLMSNWDVIIYNKVDTAGNTIWSRWPQFESTATKVYSLPDSTYLVIEAPTYPIGMKISLLDSLGFPITTILDTSNSLYASSTVGIEKLNNQITVYTGRRVILGDGLGYSLCNQELGNLIGVDSVGPTPSTLLFPTFSSYTLTDSLIQYQYHRGVSLHTECITTNIEQSQLSENHFTISPNPATDQFVVESLVIRENTVLEIFNTLGEKIYSAVYSGPLTVDCEHFPRGIYFVLISNYENQLTQKLIVE